MIDYSVIIQLCAEIVTKALPVGVVFLFCEKLVGMFIKMLFGRWGV